jgi:hypothetical protein
MNDDPLVELIDQATVDFIDSMLERQRADGLWLATDDDKNEHVRRLKYWACLVLGAQGWRDRTKPSCSTDKLPVSHIELVEEGIERRNLLPRQQLVYKFGESLWNTKYNYKQHPVFNLYACGVMAHQCTPDYIKEDPELLADFLSKPLAGLDEHLNFNTPEMIAEKGAFREKCRQMMIDRGLPMDRVRAACGY